MSRYRARSSSDSAASSEPTYWVQVFTLHTWQEFLRAGGKVTGFRATRWGLIQQIKPGDLILCYITKVGKWIGILKVESEPFLDESPIWKDEPFPCRADVRVIVKLPPASAVPIRDLKDRLSIFRQNNWGVHLIASPSRWKASDAAAVADAVMKAGAANSS
jgi:predicted RNA-binding protein